MCEEINLDFLEEFLQILSLAREGRWRLHLLLGFS